MKNLNKYFRWFMWALIIISVAVLVWGWGIVGYPSSTAEPDGGSVSVLFYWTYIITAIAVFCVVVFGVAVAIANNPKSLVKLGVALVVVVAVCALAYVLAPGNPAVGMAGEQPDGSVLKLTDTILNLTYLFGAIAVVAWIFGEVWGAVRNK